MADTKGDRRMTGVPYIEMHGHMANDEHVVDVALSSADMPQGQRWAAPLLVTACDQEARPGYATMKAHEYQDDPDTLKVTTSPHIFADVHVV